MTDERAKNPASEGATAATRKETGRASFVRRHALSLLAAGAIVVLSVVPIPENPPMEDVPFIDKWVHLAMYGGLSLMMWVDHAVRGGRRPGAGFLALALLLPTALGGVLELVQAHLTTCRSGDWIDFWADGFGALVVTLFLPLLSRFSGRPPKGGSRTRPDR